MRGLPNIVALHLTTLKPDDRDVARKRTDQARIHRQHAKTITHRDIEETQKVHHKPTSWDGLPFPAQRMEVDSETVESSLTHCHSMQMNFIQETAASSPAGALAHWPCCHTSIKYRCVGPKDAQTVRLHPANGASTANVPKRAHAAAEGLRKMMEHHVSDSKIKNTSLQRPHQSQ